jgi:hypothetical protein
MYAEQLQQEIEDEKDHILVMQMIQANESKMKKTNSKGANIISQD